MAARRLFAEMRVAEFWRRFKNLEGKRYGKRLYTLEDVKIKMFGEWEEAGHFEDHSSGGAAMGLTALLTTHLPDANKSGLLIISAPQISTFSTDNGIRRSPEANFL